MSNLLVVDPRAGFVDVGSKQMHVSVGGARPEVFDTVTSQLHALRDWLLSQGVRSVAMEATGVYWLPLYAVLEGAGLQVVMVNGRHLRNVPGRKSDMSDAQWDRPCTCMGCCAPVLCPRLTSGGCRTICGCAGSM